MECVSAITHPNLHAIHAPFCPLGHAPDEKAPISDDDFLLSPGAECTRHLRPWNSSQPQGSDREVTSVPELDRRSGSGCTH
eukprot:130249-Amorphochlora_amoeboformis.AAC.2